MNIRILTPRIHGILDYLAAAGLLVLPFALDLGASSQLALWLSVVGGLGLIVYSLFTDYAFGVGNLIPFKVHLILDLAAAIAFFAAPFIFGWEGLTAAYYFVMSTGVIVVVALTTTDQTYEWNVPEKMTSN
jgi:hypothetical protein